MDEKRLYDLFHAQLRAVRELLPADQQTTVTLLEQPMQEIIVHFPCVVDGRVQLLKGYRVQHSRLLGPCKGGIRYHPDVYLDECKALSAWMTVKNALNHLPLGGGKGALKLDPAQYDRATLHRISRAFCRAIRPHIGCHLDVPAPDVGTDAAIMDVMTDEFNRFAPQRDLAVFTGKSVECGGSEGRSAATGRGVMICVREWARKTKRNLQGSTFVVQGFGKVGAHAARLLVELGMVCVGVADASGHLVCDEGFNVHRVLEYVRTHGRVQGYPNGTVVDRDAFFSTRCDVFVPAALELQITAKEAPLMQCTAVFEAANGPTDADGERILRERKVQVFADVLVNSGGVIVSFFEYTQNRRDEHWSEEEVNVRLDDTLTATFERVEGAREALQCGHREACFALAIARLHHVATLQLE